MKKIHVHGINYIELLNGSNEWFYGTDYMHGDLYEAEELFKNDHPITSNRLVFVKYPEGIVLEPMKAKAGQYFGNPLYYDGKIHILLVDFKEKKILIFRYLESENKMEEIHALPLTKVKDCYNLMLDGNPLMLTRSAHDGIFQIIYTETVDITIDNGESFFEREVDKLYFDRWRD